ncbi:MAG: isopentenyl phosphate kinase [Candidatus Bathyarchaeota archaeon]|nr:isopentenyl phosphate kinase [Candidatus Bathyarchaeota archaeon]MDH5786694.1 isopentenyl phosphate kinase [Candidatus Bathyarchaeota archaeon]
MKEPKPTILKVGGSVITDKNKELDAKTQVMNRLAEEIQQAKIENLVVVHGGGGFGHPTAQKYNIKAGLKEENQKVGFAETHHIMTMLNGLFMDAFMWHKIPAVSVTPSSCIITENGRIQYFEYTLMKMLLQMDFLPVLYGDAVLDTKLGFTILSGDQLISRLAVGLNAERIIVGVDVDGLYNCDPKAEKNAKLFAHLTLEELKKLQKKTVKPTACDVTGGMFGKIAELIPAIEHGISAKIVNATKPNHIYKVLKGEDVQGTLIEKE